MIGVEMSAWLYIAAGMGAFIMFAMTFVFMTLADDWEQGNREGWDE